MVVKLIPTPHWVGVCLRANWKKQAVKKAKEYLKFSAFSKKQLYQQLIFEGFTKAQAKYGVNKAYK